MSARAEFDTFLNCPADAFRTAAATLRDRQKRYGNAALVRQWVVAQETVFFNCPGPNTFAGNGAPAAKPQIPPPLPASAPALARADRN